jgi:type IV pilus assembly protein PilX
MRRQRGGAVLPVTLMLLLIGLVIGAVVARGAFVQTKVASNFYDRQIAFQNAQAALRLGEGKANSGGGGLGPKGTTFRDCQPSAPACAPNPFTDKDNPATQGMFTVDSSEFDSSKNPGGQSGNQPQYVVEYLGNFSAPSSGFSNKSIGSGYGMHGSRPRADFYRITARSSAPGDDRASVTLQSTYYR